MKKKPASQPRSRLYRKISPKFWRDEKVRSLDPIDKLIAVYGFTGQANRIGLFTFSVGMAIEDLGLSDGTLGETLGVTFRERFRRVCETLEWGWDEAVGVVFLPTWWRYNPPENPNVLIGNLSDLDNLPQTHLLERFCDNLFHLDESLRETFTQTLGKRYPQRYPKRFPPEAVTEAVTEAEAKEPPSEVCSEPPTGVSKPSSPVVLEFPCVGRGGHKVWHLTEAKLAEYHESFPGVDVLAECRRARQWCIDNPTNRKTAQGMPAFLSRWLGKEQNDRGNARSNGRGQKDMHFGGPMAALEDSRRASQ